MVKDLGSDYAYIWITNTFFLTMTAFGPLFGQTCNIFGRRSLTLLAVFLFALGSAICGPSRNIGTMIVGRSLMGIGGGGINIMIDVIIADLLPLRERPQYIGAIFAFYSIALMLGPVIGGLLSERASWRWVFYLNLPVAGVALLLLSVVLRVRYKKDIMKNSLKRVDISGNSLLIASITSILLSLSWGGVRYRWRDWQTLLPLILGLLGLAGFIATQMVVPEPTMPLRLFSNRTSLGSFGLTFFHSILMYWICYFLPVYFQSVLGANPITSGVYLLPMVIVTMAFSVIAGVALSKIGRYRPMHFLGMITLACSFGMFTRLDDHTSTAYWAGAQCIGSIGIGLLMTTTLPAIQAPLPEADVAVAVGTWGFVRSFGAVWGVAIPGSIFNAQVDQRLGSLQDERVRALLSDGGAYGLASGGFVQSLSYNLELQAQVKAIYVDNLRLTWQVGIAFSLIGFLIAFVVKEIPLRTELETEFSLEQEQTTRDTNAVEKATKSENQ